MTLAESSIREDNQNDIVTPTAQLINTPSAEANTVPVFTKRTNTLTATAYPIITPTSMLSHSATSSAHSAESSAHSAQSPAHSAVTPTSDLPHAKSSTEMYQGSKKALELLENGQTEMAIDHLKHLTSFHSANTPSSKNNWHYKPYTQMVGKKYQYHIKMPQNYVAIRQQDLNAFEGDRKAMKRLEENLKKRQCNISKEAQWFVATALAMCPKLSGPGEEISSFGYVKAMLICFVIEKTDEQLLNVLPCKWTGESYLENFAADVFFVGASCLEEEDGRGIYFGSDKAEDKVKKGMAKILSKFLPSMATVDFLYGQIYTLVLDDGTGAKTHEGATGSVNSMEKLPNHEALTVDGVYSDSILWQRRWFCDGRQKRGVSCGWKV
jgi:hypothetical protein